MKGLVPDYIRHGVDPHRLQLPRRWHVAGCFQASGPVLHIRVIVSGIFAVFIVDSSLSMHQRFILARKFLQSEPSVGPHVHRVGWPIAYMYVSGHCLMG